MSLVPVDRITVRFPGPPGSTTLADYVGTDEWLKSVIGTEPALQFSDIVRDGNELIATADVVWPDGTLGDWTTLAATENGIDSYEVTYGLRVVTATITRDANGLATDTTLVVA